MQNLRERCEQYGCGYEDKGYPRTAAMTKSHIWKDDLKSTDSSRGNLLSSNTRVNGVSRAMDHKVL
jgi:hypothetical protein